MTSNISHPSPTAVHVTSAATQLVNDADGSNWFEDLITKDTVLPYLAGAATACCLCLVIVFAVVMWRRRSNRQCNRVALENGDCDRGDGIYVEIAEARGLKKKKQNKTKQEQDVTDNNNGPSSVPHLPPVDTAPDIVTAHDSESIYETLDGKRAAVRAKASQGTGLNQSGQKGDHGVHRSEDVQSNATLEVRASVYRLGNNVDQDSTYDHLNCFNRKPGTAKRCDSENEKMRFPEKRVTDPDVSRRQNTVNIQPRNVHSADEILGGGRSELERANQDEHVGNDHGYSVTQPIKERCDAETDENGGNRSVRASGVGRPSRSIQKESSNNSGTPKSSIVVSPKRIRRDSSSGSGSSRVSTASSSLAELARQSSADGKRIVCQLSMIGVTEDGRRVIRQQQSRGNAYFVLEPATDSTYGAAFSENCATVASLSHNATTGPKFRMRTEANQAGESACKASDYFTLEPLDDEEEVEEELFECTYTLGEMLDSNLKYNSETETEVDSARKISGSSFSGLGLSRRRHSARSSLHGHSLVKSFKDLSDVDQEVGSSFHNRTQSFRSRRISSCPTPSPQPEEDEKKEGMNCDGSPPLPPRNASYLRSFSSPKRRRRTENSPRAERRMDAETLKARIQQEMRALGFLSDLEPETNEEGSSSQKDVLIEMSGDLRDAVNSASSGLRPPRNEYFLLEPDPNAGKDDDDGDLIVRRRDDPDGRDESVRASEFAPPPPLPRQSPTPLPRLQEYARNAFQMFVPRFQRQQTTKGLPQQNPSFESVASNKGKYSHKRSRSETPVLSLGPRIYSSESKDGKGAEGGRREAQEVGRAGGIEDDEGPVVISLKKSKSVEPKTTPNSSIGEWGRGLNSHTDEENDDDFRPRVKSESSILSERIQK